MHPSRIATKFGQAENAWDAELQSILLVRHAKAKGWKRLSLTSDSFLAIKALNSASNLNDWTAVATFYEVKDLQNNFEVIELTFPGIVM